MGNAGIGLKFWNAMWNTSGHMLRNVAWRDLRDELAVKCAYCGHNQSRGLWGRMRSRSQGVLLRSEWYCRAECLERALCEFLERLRAASRHEAIPAHRVPLGLLLLSRQQVTAPQLRTALTAQRAAGHGKIGEWLQELGFATERQVTAGLARQWACPVLGTGSEEFSASLLSPIPLLLLETFRMIPVEFVKATGTLLMAFSDGIDYTALYAVEQMLGCHTEACFVCPSSLQKALQSLAQRRRPGDIVFDRTEDAGECARIIGNYSTRVGAEEIRMAVCGEHVWIRLQRLRHETLNLVLRAPVDAGSSLAVGRKRGAASA